MLNSVLSNIKKNKSFEIVEQLARKSQESLNTDSLRDMLRKALNSVIVLTEEETQALTGKLDQLGHKTTGELERLAHGLVEKLLAGNEEPVPLDIQDEIAAMIVEFNTSSRVVLHMSYVNQLLITTAPRSLADVRNFKKALISKLIEDATERISIRLNTQADA